MEGPSCPVSSCRTSRHRGCPGTRLAQRGLGRPKRQGKLCGPPFLIDAASPYSRTPREFTWLTRWAQRFAPYCSLNLQEAGKTAEKASSFVLDQSSDKGLHPASANSSESPSQYGLDTSKLATHIQAIVSQLKKGANAASLGLGDDCVQPACARLLVSLYRPWGLGAWAGDSRAIVRNSRSTFVRICWQRRSSSRARNLPRKAARRSWTSREPKPC